MVLTCTLWLYCCLAVLLSCRDRLYEAGCDEAVSWTWLGGSAEMATPEFARYVAVALIALLGIAGFAAGALRESASLKGMQVLDK